MAGSGVPSAAQSKMARGVLGWGLQTAADMAGIAKNTLVKLERGEDVREDKRTLIRRAYEKAGIEFTGQNGARWRG